MKEEHEYPSEVFIQHISRPKEEFCKCGHYVEMLASKGFVCLHCGKKKFKPNMREIKFRAWDKKMKIMKNVWKIEFGYWIYCEPYTKSEDIFWEQAELLQFTGLFDKNGKEIYEGDILRSIYSKGRAWYNKIIIVEIEEDVWGYRFYWNTIKNELIPSRTKEQIKEMRKLFDEFSGIKIIGNKFENPELLK